MRGWFLFAVLLFAPLARAGAYIWDVPDARDEISVPGVVEADGVPMKLRAVRTPWKVDELIQHFATSFENAGLFIPPTDRQPQLFQQPQLTALDPNTLVSYTVIFQANADGTTTCILGEANMAARKHPGQDGLPAYPGGSGVVRSDVEGAKTLAYSAQAKPAEVVAFYRDFLTKQGYREKEPSLFAKGTDEVRVYTRPSKTGEVQVSVFQQHVAGQPALKP